MEMMVRRYIGMDALKEGEEIDGYAIWQRAREIFYDGKMTGGQSLGQGFEAMLDLGILPPGSMLVDIAPLTDAICLALQETPLVQGHVLHSGWYEPNPENGCLDHSKRPKPDDGGHATVLMAITIKDANTYLVSQNSWGAHYGWKGYFADLAINEMRGKGWMNNISSEKFINNLAKQPSVLTEAAMREWPSLTDEQKIEWLQVNDSEREIEGEDQEQEYINFMNEYANGSFWSKMTEAEKDSFYKSIGGGNVNKIIKNIGEAIDDPSNASWIKAVMNYDDDYFEKAKEAGKREIARASCSERVS
jgi:hypothetical protein